MSQQIVEISRNGKTAFITSDPLTNSCSVVVSDNEGLQYVCGRRGFPSRVSAEQWAQEKMRKAARR